MAALSGAAQAALRPSPGWPAGGAASRLWAWLRARVGRRARAPRAAGLCALLAVCGLRALDPPVLVDARLALFDAYQRAAPRPYQPVPVRIVDIDDATLERLGQWPWPRWQVARLVDRLNELGAAVIALDVVFSEPDRTSPRNLSASWRGEPELAALAGQLEHLPDFDDRLAAAIARARVVTSFGVAETANRREPRVVAGLAMLGPDPTSFLRRFEGAVASLPVLEAAAAGNGSFSVVASGDEVIRRVPMLYALGDRIYPSLALEALRVAQGADTIKVRAYDPEKAQAAGRQAGLAEIRVGRIDVPVSPTGELWLHYTESVPERLVPAWQLLAPGVPAAELRARIAGNIVLVGTSAVGLKDLRATPLNPFEAGVAVHAQLIEQLLLGWHLERPAWGARRRSAGRHARRRPADAAAGDRRQPLERRARPRRGARPDRAVLARLWPVPAAARPDLPAADLPRSLSERHLHDLSARRAREDRAPRRVQPVSLAGPGAPARRAARAARAGRREPRDDLPVLRSRRLHRLGREGRAGAAGAAAERLSRRPLPSGDGSRRHGRQDRRRCGACDLQRAARAAGPCRARGRLRARHGRRRARVRRPAAGQGHPVRRHAHRGQHRRRRGRQFRRPAPLRLHRPWRCDQRRGASRERQPASRHPDLRRRQHRCRVADCLPFSSRLPIGRKAWSGQIEALEPVLPAADDAAPAAGYRAAYDRLRSDDPTASRAFAELAARYPDDPLVALHAARLAAGERGVAIVLLDK